MHARQLTKPDGRRLWLYSRRPIPAGIEAPGTMAPAPGRGAVATHLRWHPLRGEWVSYAPHRQGRTFLPASNPLAPSVDPARPTEVPAGDYDIAVFENLFPAFGPGDAPPAFSAAGQTIVASRPGGGVAEVVVFTQDATTSLGALPLGHIELLFAVWADRTRALGQRPDVEYVFPFENR